MNPQGGFGLNPIWRALSFLVAFVVGLASVWALGARAIAASGAERSGTALDFLPTLREWSARIAAPLAERRVAIVGDSMLFGLPGLASLPDRVGALLGRGKASERASVFSLSLPGAGPISQYCIVDEIIRAGPDLIALEVNLRAYEPRPLGMFAYPQLSGFIDTSRWVEAALLPLSDAEITVNRMSFYHWLAQPKLEPAWTVLVDRQARLLNSRSPFEMWVQKRAGGLTTADATSISSLRALRLLATATPSGSRYTPLFRDRLLGHVLDGLEPDSPRLRVLGAMVRRVRAAGIPIVVWVTPLNVDHLQSQGVGLDGLEQTLRSLRVVVESSGGEFADFHDALTDSQFRDTGDHMTLDGSDSGVAIVAPRLARKLRHVLPQRAAALPAERTAAHAVQ